MSELKPIKQGSVELGEYWVYDAEDVDAVIAELKAQVNGLHNRANLWHYNAQNEHNAAVAVRMENAKLKAKLAEKDKEIAELKEQYKDMDVTHTVHIAKMNARIEKLEDNVDFWKKKLDDEMASRRDEYEKSEKEIRRLKRALWLARAELCRRLDVDRYLRKHINSWYNENCLTWAEACVAMEVKMCKAESKCRAKAEEYK